MKAGQIVAKWDPHTHPIVTEMAGTVSFVGMEEGITIKRQTDELTGLTNIEVLDAKDRPSAGKDLRPAVTMVDDKGKDLYAAGHQRTCALLPASQRHRRCGGWCAD